MDMILEDINESNPSEVSDFYGDRELRWYQVAAINELALHLRQCRKRIMIVLPTGTGKTITIAAAMSSAAIRSALGVYDRPIRILFVALNHRLLSQAERTFVDESNVELISQSVFSDIPKDIEWDITILDESHHEACTSFQYHLEKLGDKPIVGLSATPDRSDHLLTKFETIISPLSREQAVAEGFLAPTYLNSIVDTPLRDKTNVTKSIIDTYGREFGQTMMFFRTKAEVQRVTDYLLSKHFKAVAILSQTPTELDKILNRFGVGEIQFIVNCNRLNEGIDVSGCTDVYLGRQFKSYPQLNQTIGRAARPDSECHVWELINPLASNLDTTVVVGTPEQHRLISKRQSNWVEQNFDYTSKAIGCI